MRHMYILPEAKLVIDRDQLDPIRAALAQCQGYYEVEADFNHSHVLVITLHNLPVSEELMEFRLHNILAVQPEEIIYKDEFLKCITSFEEWFEACDRAGEEDTSD